MGTPLDYRLFSNPICHNVLQHMMLLYLPEGHQNMGESVCELSIRGRLGTHASFGLTRSIF